MGLAPAYARQERGSTEPRKDDQNTLDKNDQATLGTLEQQDIPRVRLQHTQSHIIQLHMHEVTLDNQSPEVQ